MRILAMVAAAIEDVIRFTDNDAETAIEFLGATVRIERRVVLARSYGYTVEVSSTARGMGRLRAAYGEPYGLYFTVGGLKVSAFTKSGWARADELGVEKNKRTGDHETWAN